MIRCTICIFFLALTTGLWGQSFEYRKKVGKYVFKKERGGWNEQLAFDEATSTRWSGGWKVRSGQEWGFVSKAGKLVVPVAYQEVIVQGDRNLKVRSSGQWGLYSKEGNLLVPVAYEWFVWNDEEQYSLVRKDGKAGVIDAVGQELLPMDYERVDVYDLEEGSLVQQNGVWGVLLNNTFTPSNEPLIFSNPDVRPVLTRCIGQGEECMHFDYLMDVYRTMRYPAYSRQRGDQGTVILELIVNERGQLEPVKVKQSVTPELDQESLRVAQLTLKDWAPGTIDGRPVKTRIYLPISFRLQ
ncbi:MAG: TonB family protein [Bacteroidota bacterium]